MIGECSSLLNYAERCWERTGKNIPMKKSSNFKNLFFGLLILVMNKSSNRYRRTKTNPKTFKKIAEALKIEPYKLLLPSPKEK